MIARGLHDGKKSPKKIDPYGSFAAVSLLEYGDLNPILPFHGVRSDAACRIVVKRMCEEHFNHALPVLVVMRFLWGGLRGVFCPWLERAGGGAFGRGPVRATPATPVCGLLRREGVARRRQKPWGRRQGRAFFPPFLWRSKERGRGGGGGAQPPGDERGLLGVLRYDRGKTYMNNAALLGRTLAGGRALAPLGTAPTENIMSNPVMVRNVMPF